MAGLETKLRFGYSNGYAFDQIRADLRHSFCISCVLGACFDRSRRQGTAASAFCLLESGGGESAHRSGGQLSNRLGADKAINAR